MEENNELIIVKQLPIIIERFKELGEEIDKKVEMALALECTEENKTTVKKIRADLNKEKKEYEQKRKDVKSAVMKPYEEFEEAYKTFIGNKYSLVDAELKNKIDLIENAQIDELKQEAINYFIEYKENLKIDFVDFEQLKLNIGVSSTKTALKRQIKESLDSIQNDIWLINSQEYRDEIMVEYKQSLDVRDAITKVINRKEMLIREQQIKESQQKEIETIKNNLEKFEEAIKNEQTLDAPVEEIIEVKEVEKKEASFKVKATLGDLKELVQFLNNKGIEWEQI